MTKDFYDSQDYWDAVAETKRERYRERAMSRYVNLGPEWYEDWMGEDDNDDDDMYCVECGELMWIGEDGVSHHLGSGKEKIDFDADADHVPYVSGDN